jgi:hypothetical protein
MGEALTASERRQEQAALCRLLLHYTACPFAPYAWVRGCPPWPEGLRVAVHCGEETEGIDFLYELPFGMLPAAIPGALAQVVSGLQLYSSSKVKDVMGMNHVSLDVEKIPPVPLGEGAQAVEVLRQLAEAYEEGEEGEPFLLGFLMRPAHTLRLYVNSPERKVWGVDVPLPRTGLGLLGAVQSPGYLNNPHLHRPSDDPHADVLIDLSDN